MKGLTLENIANTSPRGKPIAKGFQHNLLANTLTTKLKQRKPNPSDKENASRIISAKPPKQARKSSILVTSKNGQSAVDFTKDDRASCGGISRTGSGVSSVRSTSRLFGRQLRIDSATSDKLPCLSPGRQTSSRGSRRTISADGGLFRVTPSSCGSGRNSASTSFYPSTDSPGLVFEPASGDQMIKVIKRDGVFQPIDKYASCRQHGRDVDIGCRGLACDYELFTLPLSCEDNAVSTAKNGHTVSRGRSDYSKKQMKVSWSHVMEHDDPDALDVVIESRVDVTPTPVACGTITRPVCKDNMAFKRPVYCSGKNRIKSIGVKWTVPTVGADEEGDQRQLPIASSSSTPASKPMWSWLVTPEPVKQNQPRVTSVGQLSRASKSKECSTPSSLVRSTSMFDIRTQHCRDVHPVATAMDRQGTSVTKTKWHVPPSSSTSTYNPTQVAMDRLQMVKRPGKRLVYDSSREDFDIALKLQQNDPDGEESENDGEYNVLEMNGSDGRREDDMNTSTTTRRDDAGTSSSPTKSRSTLRC